MKVVALALLLVAAALAGCSDDGPDDGPPGTTTTSTTTTRTTTSTQTQAPPTSLEIPLILGFAMDGCDGISLAVQVPAEDVQALLPGNFTVAPYEGPTQALGGAVVVLDMFHCGNFTTAAGPVGHTWFGHLYTFVEDPGFGVGADVHEYVFLILAGHDPLAPLWPLAGYPTHNGTAGIDDTDGDPTGLLAPRMRTLTAGDYVIEGSGLGVSSAQLGPETFVRYTMLEDGSRLQWTGTQTLPVAQEGPGEATIPADSPFADIEADRPLGLTGTAVLTDGATFEAMDLMRVFMP